MPVPSKENATRAIERIAEILVAAGGTDGVISRRDYRNLLPTLPGFERALADAFFKFIDDRDDKPGARVTAKDITASLAYVKRHLIDAYNLSGQTFAPEEKAILPRPARLAAELTDILRKSPKSSTATGQDLLRILKDLTMSLIFDDFASEGENPIAPVFKPVLVKEITEETVQEVFALDDRDINQRIVRSFPLESDTNFWPNFVKLNTYIQRGDQAEELQIFMRTNLRDLTAVILGEDKTDANPRHRVLIIGISATGEIAGFESVVIWT
ncbi:MAG: hypothetical protein AAGN35_04960 [Bacteroidota bacterium]